MDAYPKEGFFIDKGRKSSVEYEGRKALFDSGVGARPTGKSLKFPSPPPPSLPKKKEERRPPSSASSFDDGDRSASLRLGLPTRIERAKFVPSHRRWRVRRKQGEGMDALWANRFFSREEKVERRGPSLLLGTSHSQRFFFATAAAVGWADRQGQGRGGIWKSNEAAEKINCMFLVHTRLQQRNYSLIANSAAVNGSQFPCISFCKN